jgi:hypothetical protein
MLIVLAPSSVRFEKHPIARCAASMCLISPPSIASTKNGPLPRSCTPPGSACLNCYGTSSALPAAGVLDASTTLKTVNREEPTLFKPSANSWRSCSRRPLRVIFDRLSRFCLPKHVCFAPKATGVLHCRKMTRCANSCHMRCNKKRCYSISLSARARSIVFRSRATVQYVVGLRRASGPVGAAGANSRRIARRLATR